MTDTDRVARLIAEADATKFDSLEQFLSERSAGRNLLDEWAAEALDEEGNLR